MSREIMLEGDLNKLKQTEVRKIATLLNKTNKACWDAVGYIGELNKVIGNIDKEEHSELLRRIAETFLKVCHDARLIDMDLYGSETQEYSQYASIFNEILDEID